MIVDTLLLIFMSLLLLLGIGLIVLQLVLVVYCMVKDLSRVFREKGL